MWQGPDFTGGEQRGTLDNQHGARPLQTRKPFLLSRKYGTNQTVKARLWPWLSGKNSKLFQVFSLSSKAARSCELRRYLEGL
jgi:hypothetical protein